MKQNQQSLNPKIARINPRVELGLKQEISEFCESAGIKVADFARTALVEHLEKVKTPAA